MNESQILIINDIQSIIANKSLSAFINNEEQNFNNKSFISKLVKDYLYDNTLYSNDVLEKYNFKLKFIPINSDYKCYEALSFPFTSLYNIIFEEWNTDDELMEAQLKKSLSYVFIFIPIIKERTRSKYNDSNKWLIGELSVWKPSKKELDHIYEEWFKAKAIIKEGIVITKKKYGSGYRMNNNLLKESSTNYIHLRPHGLNSFDYDKKYQEYTDGRIDITKQSFWLNKKFINNLLEKFKWKTNLKEE